MTSKSMTLRQTNRAINTIRLLTHKNPMSTELHDQVTKVLLDLLKQRDHMKSQGESK